MSTRQYINGKVFRTRSVLRTNRFFESLLSLLALVGVGAFSSVHAAGFALYEMSAKANATGGGVIGKPADASANFFNPAGLSSLTGTVVTVTRRF